MTDPDGDGIYSITMSGLTPGDTIEYKFMVDYWAGQEDLVDDMVNGATCAPIWDEAGGYANRLLPAGENSNDTYGSCEACPDPVPGCTDAAACNYNAEATEDDLSCTYAAANAACNGDCLEGFTVWRRTLTVTIDCSRMRFG
jgi:hypothetical protein